MIPHREIHCADAIQWLGSQAPLAGCSIVTSLPDASEFPQFTLEQWKAWFVDAAALVLSRCPDDGVTIFYQTDLKKDGVWIDKGYLVQKAAEQSGHPLIWHKLACRVPAGVTTFGRPAFSHLLCFSKSIRNDLGKSTPDVLTSTGETTWTRGMGTEACRASCEYILSHTQTRTVVDPFCGHGTVLAVANALGLSAVGVELSAKRAKKARNLRYLKAADGKETLESTQ